MRKKRVVVEKRDVMFIEPVTSDENTIDMSDFLINDTQPEEDNAVEVNPVVSDENSTSEDEDAFFGFDEDDQPTNNIEEIDDFNENNDVFNKEEQVGKPSVGRPKIVRTGKPGRPKKIRNTLNFIENEDVEIPQTVEEAVNGKFANKWKQSMKNEYDALIANKTWSLTELPKGQKAIGSKWVFNAKRNKDGEIEKFKSRLVAKGCSQQFGVNYTETFSSVIRYETIRMVFALAAELKMYLHQMDVCTAYLNSDLSEEVYMKQPQRFVNEQHPDYVLKLNKAIYGLKQSGREWNSKLDEVLRNIGFSACVNDPCFYKMTHKGKL